MVMIVTFTCANLLRFREEYCGLHQRLADYTARHDDGDSNELTKYFRVIGMTVDNDIEPLHVSKAGQTRFTVYRHKVSILHVGGRSLFIFHIGGTSLEVYA